MKIIYVSILNWNDAVSTILCVDSISQCAVPAGYESRIVVIDNGSRFDDTAILRAGLENSRLITHYLPENVGFASGHNVTINLAVQEQAEFIWLVNNDAIVAPETLVGLVQAISNDPKCGIISPLIFALHDESQVDFVGATHDWGLLDSRRAVDPTMGKKMMEASPSEFFVYGTAPLIRIAALRSSGALAAEYFAYYEDEEFCARLSASGWTSKMDFKTRIQHRHQRQAFVKRPPYYFYLMARNSLRFYKQHTPRPHRRLISLRLFSRAMIKAAQLREAGHIEKCNACLLGILDGLRGCTGQPRLDRSPPIWLIGVSKIFPYRIQQWLS